MSANVRDDIATASDREIVSTRRFDAPRDVVFAMWSDASHLANWWGPHGFTLTTSAFDFRPGGEWKFVFHGPDGRDYRNHIVYGQITRPERITYKHLGEPLFDVVVTFTPDGAGTRVSVRMTFASAEERERVARTYGAVEGLEQTLSRLDEALSAREHEPFVVSRTFDAPRDLVFKLWTDENHLAQWFGPRGADVFHSKNHLRVGATYHYAMRSGGQDLWGRWTYREITPPSRLVFVSSFSDAEGALREAPFFDGVWPMEILSTVVFEETGGKTKITLTWMPLRATEDQWRSFNQERRGMTGGWSGTFDRLADLIAAL